MPGNLKARLTRKIAAKFGEWYQVRKYPGLLKLIFVREELRAGNLYDTDPQWRAAPETPPMPQSTAVRQADGSWTDLNEPRMGMVGTRYGRNAPLSWVHPDKENILNPNPRMISRDLMARREFVPAKILNVIAAAWIQFMIHDWTDHGPNEKEDPFKVPPPPGEKGTTEIRRSRVDRTRAPNEELPDTWQNLVTPWWDGSQLYGSDEETVRAVRSGSFDGKNEVAPHGKLATITDENGNVRLPIDDRRVWPQDLAGVNENFWVGLSVLHAAFVQEHNTICDALRREYPDWSGDELFDRARLITSALMAKIHTVEWTPGIIPNPTTYDAMLGSWYGFFGGKFQRFSKYINRNEVLEGIPGSPVDHFGVPYTITEEFVTVYRLHSLIPDELEFRSVGDNSVRETRGFQEVTGSKNRDVVDQLGWVDTIYSLGSSYPGAITLHNFPNSLRNHIRETKDQPAGEGRVIDLAAVDLVRDRERGIPRYNDFRENMHLPRLKDFSELTDNPVWAEEIRQAYDNDIDMVDTQIGLVAEPFPPAFGFSDTAFRIFVLMAGRRLKSDRFYTDDYNAETYTQLGIDWVENTTMRDVFLRHWPELAPALKGIDNAFVPWNGTAP